MLSRVAENLYWLGRYVERAENTARMVNVNANLLLDLPKGIAPGWQPLIAVTGSEDLYAARHSDFDERSVVKFLLADRDNPSSILASLAKARENTRTMRDTVPREAWEEINELYLYARDNLQAGLSKRGRYAYLRRIFHSAHALGGLLAGTMSHDLGYDFLRVGRNIERADMTTRFIDVRTETLLPEEETAGLRPFDNIQWVSVLKSLTAYQMYRRTIQARVRRIDVLRFLFLDPSFPRAVNRCVTVVEACISRLPRNEAPLRALGRLKRLLLNVDLREISQSDLHTFIDQVQSGLGQVHSEIATTYFLVDTASPGLAAGD